MAVYANPLRFLVQNRNFGSPPQQLRWVGLWEQSENASPRSRAQGEVVRLGDMRGEWKIIQLISMGYMTVALGGDGIGGALANAGFSERACPAGRNGQIVCWVETADK